MRHRNATFAKLSAYVASRVQTPAAAHKPITGVGVFRHDQEFTFADCWPIDGPTSRFPAETVGHRGLHLVLGKTLRPCGVRHALPAQGANATRSEVEDLLAGMRAGHTEVPANFGITRILDRSTPFTQPLVARYNICTGLHRSPVYAGEKLLLINREGRRFR